MRIRLILTAIVALAASLVLLPVAASAATVTPSPSEGLTFSLQPLVILSIISSVLLPLLVGLVTNSTWSSRAKGILHAALAAVSGFVAELVDFLTNGGTYDAGAGLLAALAIFVSGVGVYAGILKPDGANGTSIAVTLRDLGGINLK